MSNTWPTVIDIPGPSAVAALLCLGGVRLILPESYDKGAGPPSTRLGRCQLYATCNLGRNGVPAVMAQKTTKFA
ncbi:hypothetical protein GOAMI_49_00080 [Gordonia amicalis NBRC 100051 = JCM 11271]|nr:hypothetical protein GOAMI_49_00080 [Gordonia amicalis NBRC 100051 = JCM 11271]